jgi:hypothetical protein
MQFTVDPIIMAAGSRNGEPPPQVRASASHGSEWISVPTSIDHALESDRRGHLNGKESYREDCQPLAGAASFEVRPRSSKQARAALDQAVAGRDLARLSIAAARMID